MTPLVLKLFLMVPRGKKGDVVHRFHSADADDNNPCKVSLGWPAAETTICPPLQSQQLAADSATAWLAPPRLAGLLCQDGNCLQ